MPRSPSWIGHVKIKDFSTRSRKKRYGEKIQRSIISVWGWKRKNGRWDRIVEVLVRKKWEKEEDAVAGIEWI
jgi:hypothetical protein